MSTLIFDHADLHPSGWEMDSFTLRPRFHDHYGGGSVEGQTCHWAVHDSTILPFYAFMATNLAMSDRWFSSVMTRTQPNRMYGVAATSDGHVTRRWARKSSRPTIFDRLQAAGISWRVYVPAGYLLHPGLGFGSGLISQREEPSRELRIRQGLQNGC